MLSRTPEIRLRWLRGLLAVLWLLLIASLLADPRMPAWGNAAPVPAQAHWGNSVFWGLLIPLLPLLLMVLGHEAWRRICPLSFISQIPRYLRLQLTRRHVDRQTGRVERTVRTIARDGWLARNAWVLQFGLLAVGVTGRLLIFNSHPVALAALLLAVMAAALAVGVVYAGKSWCHYFCPISVVQKVYTQPRGLLESQAHLVKIPITQAMCRTTLKGKETGTCVACTASCPDIDLEKHYWNTVQQSSRPFVYYGLFGLILGFYSYFAVFSGSWDYYFHGAWLRESADIALAPGFHVPQGSSLVSPPRWLAAPLWMAFCIGCSLLAWTTIARAYTKARSRRDHRHPAHYWQHHVLMASAFASFVLFYIFAGYGYRMMLPVWLRHVVDMVLMAVPAIWVARSVSRTPWRFQRESLREVMLKSLQALRIDLSKMLDGKSLDDLGSDEVYVLAKALPATSADGKLGFYTEVLREALQSGTVSAKDSRRLLADMRRQIGLSDEEHATLLAQVLQQIERTEGAASDVDTERRQRLDSYERVLRGLVDADARLHVDKIRACLQRPEAETELAEARRLFGVTPEQHADLASRLEQELVHAEQFAINLKLADLAAWTAYRVSVALGADPRFEPIRALFVREIDARRAVHLRHALADLARLGSAPAAREMAQRLFQMAGDLLGRDLVDAEADDGMNQLRLLLPPDVQAALQGDVDAVTPDAFQAAWQVQELYGAADDLPTTLSYLAQDPDAILACLAAYGAACLDRGPDERTMQRLGRELDAAVIDAIWARSRAHAHPDDPYGPDVFHVVIALAGADALSDLRLEALLTLALHARWRRLQRGDFVSRAGQASRELSVVARGLLEGWRERNGSREVVGQFAAGQVAGAMGALTGAPRVTHLEVVSAQAEVIGLREQDVRQVARDCPQLARRLLMLGAQYLQTVYRLGQVPDSDAGGAALQAGRGVPVP